MAEEEPAAPPAEAEPKEEAEAPAEAAAADEAAAEPEAEKPADPEPEPEAEKPAEAEPEAEPEKPADPPAEEVKEEPAKKKKSKKKKKKKAVGDGENAEAAALWDEISSKKATDLNWYALELDGKAGSTTALKEVQRGTGGAKEIIKFTEDKQKNILFILLKAVTTDDAKSVRSKFIYIRFLGSGVKTMTKAKLTPMMGKIDDNFPCKHLTMDLNEKDASSDLVPEKLARELLRVGGAHKPDEISFGPDQVIDVKSYKNN